MQQIAILGSTGSIGVNALEVVRNLNAAHPAPKGAGECTVAGLSARNNWQILAQQIRHFSPRFAAVTDEAAFAPLKQSLNGVSTQLLQGAPGLETIAAADGIDLVLIALSGAAGLQPTLKALETGKRVALANKESMVMAGPLLIQHAMSRPPRIIPVDSEHSAIFQALACGRHREVRRLILTTSGGPFLNTPKEELRTATPEQALKHPVWAMGKKITIDSATMMNKALEIVEARWLFNIPSSQIEVLVHPQSIIHSMVEFCDGSTIAQMSVPDMKAPIQYAFTYPHRAPAATPFLDLAQVRSLTFQKPDPDRFPALRLGSLAAQQGGTMGAVMNAANEVAVQVFLDRRIPFTDIVRTVETVMSQHKLIASPTLHDILLADRWARETAAATLKL